MRRILIGAVTAAGIVGGSIAVAAVNPFGVAGAQDGGQAPATTAPADPTEPGPDGAGRGRHGAPGRVLDETLDDLVAKGTITQEQADAVRNGLKERIGAGGRGEGHGRGGPGVHGVGELFGTAAEALGMTTDELKVELKAGKSIADVARARGIDPQTVIDAIVASVDAKIDQAVADGKMSADRAEAAKAKVRERITEMVNNTGGAFKGHGRGHGHGRGSHGDDEGDADDDDTSPPSTGAPSAEPPAGEEAPTTEAPSSTDGPAPTEAPVPTSPTGTTA
jgi:polyhydroxyalkanoate synthesis regulator phasin